MGCMIGLETERLRLEPWAPAHGSMLARLAALPEIMRYVGNGVPWTAAEEAFTRLGAPSVVARIQPGNVASIRVAAALGLERERDTAGRLGEPVRILRLRAPGSNRAGGG
jgi:RimJ/RimL family protein N-acetyltransferase